MRHALQALASRTLQADRRQLNSLTTSVFEAVANLWHQGNDLILHGLSEFANQRATAEQIVAVEMEAVVTLEALRVLHLLLQYGFAGWKADSQPMAALRLILDRYGVVVAARDSLGAASPLAKWTRKYIKAFGRLQLDILEKNAASFVPLISTALEFCFTNVVLRTAQSLRYEKFLVDNMIFMEKCMDPTVFKQGTAGAAVVDSFFSVDRQKELVQLIVTQLFPLTPKDLEEWEAQPEEFIHDAGTDAASEKYRPCAENLFLVLLRRNKAVIGPWIVSVLHQVSQMPPSTLESILARDACYNAIALGCWELPPYIDFGSWFRNSLQVELNTDRQNQQSPWRILRRRIADLLGMWVAAHPHDIKQATYGCLNELMQEEDLVIAFAASQSVNYVVGDTTFTAEEFMPFLDTTVRSLFNILQRAELVDTKLRVIPSLRTTIEQVGHLIGPYADGIVNMLAQLWTSPTCTSFLRQATIRTLTKIVEAIGESTRFASFLYPVISYSVTYGSEDLLYVLEDGLDLWLAVVNTSGSFSPDLLQLFPRLLGLMSHTVNQISHCMKIVEAYILLGRTEFLQVYMPDLGRLFATLAGDLLDDSAPYIVKPLETLLMLYPQESPPLLQGTFNKMLLQVLQSAVSDRTITHFLAVFGRVLLHNQPFFLTWFRSLKSENPGENVMSLFLRKWAASFEPMPDLRRRKMAALALMSLFSVPEFASSFSDEAAIIVEECIGVALDELAGPGPEYRARPDAEDYDDEPILDLPSTSVGIQTQQLAFLFQSDPVNGVPLRPYIQAKMAECERIDPNGYAAVLRLVEPLVLQQFAESGQ